MVHLELYFIYMVVLKALISNTDWTVFMIHVVLHMSNIHAKENTTDTFSNRTITGIENKVQNRLFHNNTTIKRISASSLKCYHEQWKELKLYSKKKLLSVLKREQKIKCLYAVANSHIAEQASHLAESPHGQLPFKRGKASSVLEKNKSLAFLPNKTLVKRYLTLLTTKCLFFPFHTNNVRLTETYFRGENASIFLSRKLQPTKSKQTNKKINITNVSQH